MSKGKAAIYRRGEFWLTLDTGKDGQPTSPNLYIWWYDAGRGRLRRKSARTSDIRRAIEACDRHYLAVHKPDAEDRATYSASDIMADYFLEHGSAMASADAIKTRLKHFQAFIDVEVQAGQLRDPVMVEQIDDLALDRFRAWSASIPIVARKKDKDGRWITGKTRLRSPATIEESIIAFKASVNHAAANRRIAAPLPLRHKTRAEVTPARNDRITVATMAEMLDYTTRGAGRYGGHAGRLMQLRRYLIAAITTLARPDAILDVSVASERGQWLRDDRLFALNQAGRIQTKKRRPTVPVGDLLGQWLAATDEWFVCKEIQREDEDGDEVIDQIAVKSVRSAWDTMREELKLPGGWGVKLLRHSMATELRRRRVDPWELKGQLGHRMPGSTEIYAIFDPDYLGTVQAGIADVVADLSKACGSAIHPNFTRKSDNVVRLHAAR